MSAGSHRAHAGGSRTRTRLWPALLVAAVMTAMGATTVPVAGCGGGGGSGGRESTSRTASTGTSVAGAERSARRSLEHRRLAVRRQGTPPGELPQTHAFPSSRSAQFRGEMAALWRAIATGSAERGLSAFFPEQAYVRLKAISSAGADWTDRLVHELKLDVGAAHALLGSRAAEARLLSVRVPSEYGHWVQPGTCFNGIGYYEVPNARIVYREGGRTHSIGIASMISWRGQWYVVHLGAVLRSGDEGVVDEASEGAGTSVDSGTC